jgi:hypothetical protein
MQQFHSRGGDSSPMIGLRRPSSISFDNQLSLGNNKGLFTPAVVVPSSTAMVDDNGKRAFVDILNNSAEPSAKDQKTSKDLW